MESCLSSSSSIYSFFFVFLRSFWTFLEHFGVFLGILEYILPTFANVSFRSLFGMGIMFVFVFVLFSKLYGLFVFVFIFVLVIGSCLSLSSFRFQNFMVCLSSSSSSFWIMGSCLSSSSFRQR